MNNDTCTTCGGDGIVGSGAVPTEKSGNVSTCGVCAGTGKVEGDVVEEVAVVEATPEVVAEEVAPTEEVVVAPTE